MIDNHVAVVGRVYEKNLRYTKNGNAVLNLRVGVKDNAKTPLTMLDVVMWGKIAEHADKVMTEKCRVLLEGALRQDRWENSDGQKRTKLYIKANRFLPIDDTKLFAGAGKEEAEQETAAVEPEGPSRPPMMTPGPEQPVNTTEEEGNEVPF
jgi:single-strand DNA-binding protein